MNARLNHIGIIARDIEESIQIYYELGYVETGYFKDLIQHNIIVKMLNQKNKLEIELIKPMDEKSFVWKSQEGYHHMCYQVKNFQEIQNLLQKKDGLLIREPMKAIAFDNKEVCFVCLLTGEIIEFLLEE